MLTHAFECHDSRLPINSLKNIWCWQLYRVSQLKFLLWHFLDSKHLKILFTVLVYILE